MKILIATPLYPPEIGGPATYTKEVEDALPKRGVEVVVVPFAAVRSLPKIFRHLAYFWRVYRAARRVDIVFAQDTVSCGLPALLAARAARAKFLVRVPGDHAWEQGYQRFGVTDSIDAFQKKRYGFRVELLRLMARLVVQNADRVIIPSQYFGHLVTGWGVTLRNLRVIYNGIQTPLPEPKSLPIASPLTLVSVGRLVPWKGFGGLIELLARMPEWHLVVVGDGPLREDLLVQAQKLGVVERVRFVGSLSRGEVVGWYQVATAFVLNTSFESFSFQTLEAMAAGIPVIATSIGSIPELITDELEGKLVNPNDLAGLQRAVESVQKEPEVWQRRVEAAKSKAQLFSIQQTTESLLAVLKEIV